MDSRIYKTPWYVYAHLHPKTNEVFYIGKGKGDRRFVPRRNNRYWINVVRKYGQYKIIILEKLATEYNAFEAEKKWIKIYKDLGHNLANATEGGKGTKGYKFTEKQKDVLKARRKPDPNKVSNTLKKMWKNPYYKEHMVKAHTGHKESEETRRKKSLKLTGRIVSLETRRKISMSHHLNKIKI